MTTAAQDLVTTLSATFSGKFYPSVAKAGTADPYAVWLMVDGVPVSDLDGQSSLTNFRFQVDIFGRVKTDVDALAILAMAAMNAATLFKSVCLNMQDIWEDAAQFYRVSLDFSIWR